MSNIDWSKAPEGTTEIVMIDETKAIRWAKKSHVWSFAYRKWRPRGEDWVTIAIREPEQRKTVEDAVNDCVCVENELGYEWDCVLHDGESYYFVGGDYADRWGHQLVCTREEFEDYVAATTIKSEPKWTHIDAFGDPCRVIVDAPDCHGKVVIFRQDGWYATVVASSLKPIKPKITKAEAWDRLMRKKMNSPEVNTIKQKYIIVDRNE